MSPSNTAWKVSVSWVFLVRIFPHSDWNRRDTPYTQENTNKKNSEYGHFLGSVTSYECKFQELINWTMKCLTPCKISLIECFCRNSSGVIVLNCFHWKSSIVYVWLSRLWQGSINQFAPNAPFSYPLKASENHAVFWCFQELEKGCIGSKWVKMHGVPSWVRIPSKNENFYVEKGW